MPRGNGINRILVVELWNIGDIVLTIPFLARLRDTFPAATVSLLGQPHARVILEDTGLVDEYIETNLAWSRSGPANPFIYHWREFIGAVRQLKRRKFDLAFQGRRHIREHVLLKLSGAKRRVGYGDGPSARLLTDATARRNDVRHKADEWLDLLVPFGGNAERAANGATPLLRIAESERQWAEQFLVAHGVSASDVLVGIHPGASVPEKRWPLARFREVTAFIAQRQGVRALVFVDPGGYGTELGEVEGVVSAKLDLRRMMALLERCAFLLCNDSGPMHIAGALGVPTVAVFGSGIPEMFAPLGEGHHLVVADHNSALGKNFRRTPRPYDVSEVATSKVLDATGCALDTATATQLGRREASILQSHGRE